jgi:hypothetical protein
MKKFVYSVWYGPVPYKQKIFTKYSDASRFIKEQIDAGFIIHSVHKEWAEYTDEDVEA